jgi:hypothetical protein
LALEDMASMGDAQRYTRDQMAMVQSMLGQNANIVEIAKAAGLSRQTVYRIKDDPSAAEAALAIWSDKPRLSTHHTMHGPLLRGGPCHAAPHWLASVASHEKRGKLFGPSSLEF